MRRFAFLAASALLGSSGFALAQQITPPAASGAGGAAVPEIVVTAPPPINVLEQPAAQTVNTIDREMFEHTPAFSIGDVMQSSPGVTIKQGNGPRDVGISIRGSNDRNGFGIRNIQVLEDGFPVTQPDGLSRTDLTDPHAYNGVDVYRGPSSAMFGNYATGGAVNFRTRRGRDIEGYEIGTDVGSFGYLNSYGTFGRKVDPYEYSLFGSAVSGHGFIEHSTYTTTTGNALISYDATPSDKFTAKLITNFVDTALPIRLSLNQYRTNPYQKGCNDLNPGCATVSLFRNGTSGATVATTAAQAGLNRRDERHIGGVRWEHAIDGNTQWRSQLVADSKVIRQPTGATAAIGDTPAFNLVNDITQRGGLFGLDATHFVGVFGNYEYLDNSTFNVAPGGSAQLGSLVSRFDGHHSNYGARAREEVNLSPEWTVVAGASIEETELQATNKIVATSVVTHVNRKFLNNAYEAGLRYRPADEWQFRSRVGTGYGTPQASNLFVTSSGAAGNNTDLKTQTNTGYDLGADWTPINNLTFGVTGFYEFFQNEFVTQSPGAGLSSFTFNAPKSEHRGVELTADWKPAPGWRFLMSYLHNDQYYTEYTERLSAGAQSATFNRKDKKIPGVQPNYIFSRLGYDQADGPLAGVGGFIELNWRDAFFVDNGNLLKADDYEVVNLNLHYDPEINGSTVKGLRLFFMVHNVFDQTYIASANNVTNTISSVNGSENGAATLANSTGSIFAGSPRAFYGGVKLKF